MPKKKEKRFTEIDQYDFGNLEGDSKVIQSFAYWVGKFIIKFSQLEHEINLSISMYFCDDMVSVGYLVLDGLSVKQKISLFERLYLQSLKLRSKKTISFEKIVKELNEINEFRNDIVHANWGTFSSDGYIRERIKFRKKEDGDLLRSSEFWLSKSIFNQKIRRIEVLTERVWEIGDSFPGS